MFARSFHQIWLGVALIAGFVACNPHSFTIDQAPSSPGATTTGGGGGTCTATNVENILRQTKILFVVDTSGSNVATTSYPATSACNNGNGTCVVPPTDPQKSFRGGTISDFLARYTHKTNFNWGFLTFADSTAHAYVNDGNDQNPLFSADPNAEQMAINSFYQIRDYGQTPYRAAINLAAKAIANDPDKNASGKPNYFVILLTDGFPTDYYTSGGQYDSGAMQSDIHALLSLAPGQVSLSTIYYGKDNNPEALSLLQSMASQGGGQFANVNDPNSNFQIDDVIPGSKTGCP